MGKMKAHIVKPEKQKERERIIELTKEYTTFCEVKEDIAQQMVAAMLHAYHLKGYRHKRINDMFEAFVSVLDMPPVLGQQMEGIKIMEFLTERYGIDFKRVDLKTETETEYLARMMKNS